MIYTYFMNTLYYLHISILLLVIFLSSHSLDAQMSADLKNYLWNRDIKNLIENEADEIIYLTDEGDSLRRIAARPYQETTGIRVQLFAGTDFINAEKVAAEARALDLDSVYVIEEKGIYKVQLGNYTEHLEAEKMLDQLRFVGISNAWITQSTIHTPKKASGSATITHDLKGSDTLKVVYAIQVFVTHSNDKAKRLAQKISQKFDNTQVIKQGQYWKILIGRYYSEEIARSKLSQIINSGYPDAWLTQITE